jgi:hypothetical protein
MQRRLAAMGSLLCQWSEAVAAALAERAKTHCCTDLPSVPLYPITVDLAPYICKVSAQEWATQRLAGALSKSMGEMKSPARRMRLRFTIQVRNNTFRTLSLLEGS